MKDLQIARHARLISFLTGLIFVAHPIQTQAVTYITQRATSMAAFFYLASLIFYVKSRLLQGSNSASGFRKAYFTGALVTGVAAMFTKEMTVTLPLMICLYEFSFFKTDKRRFDGGRLWPFLLIPLVVPLTMFFTKSINFLEMRRVTEPLPEISSWHYLLTQFRVIVTYIRLTFLPIHQNMDYDYPVAHFFFQPPVLASFLFLAAIIAVAFRLFRNHRLMSFGILWFFLALLPESSILPIKDVIFEHRLYLPMAGFSLFLVSSVYNFFAKTNVKQAVIILLAIMACYSVLTYQRNKVWKDEFTFWDDVIQKSPHKERPYYNRGNAYKAKGDLDRAILDFNKAIEIRPSFAEVHNNLGNIYQIKGDLDRAIRCYNLAVEIKPDFHEAYNNRGGAYQIKGDLDQAFRDFSKAIEIKPNYARAYGNLGNIYQIKGELDQAILAYSRAIEIRPDDAKALSNRAATYFKKQDTLRSREDVHRAQALGYSVDPGFIEQLEKAS
jgi:tetratricopeptide (TPR) repeat protein